MGLMSRALRSAQPDGGSLLKRALALRTRVTADLPDAASSGPHAADVSTDEQSSAHAFAEAAQPAVTEAPFHEPDTREAAAGQALDPEKKKPSTQFSRPRSFGRRPRRERSFTPSPRCLTA